MSPIVPSAPFALFLDADGTLLDIAARPDGVAVPASLLRSLRALNARCEGALALVSGRSIADLDGLFAPLRLRASGVHGAEMRLEPGGDVHILPDHLLPETLVATLRDIAGRYPGTLVENKRFSVAVHYRAAPTAGPDLRRDIEDLLATGSSDGCRILPGHMVFEIKRAGFDKGTAVDAFLALPPFKDRLPIFIGDDVTDLPGFAAALRHGGVAFSVTTPRPGTTAHFATPADVRAWLEALAAA